jgi:hypothetical protein
MSFNQFSTVKRHVFHATNGSFKMRYRQKWTKAFGDWTKIVWTRANLWRVQVWVRWQRNSWNNMILVNDTYGRGPVIYGEWYSEFNPLHRQGLEVTSKWFPKNCWCYSLMDHGQGALRGFAKILLASPELRKEVTWATDVLL